MHTNFGGVLRKAEISETFVTREGAKSAKEALRADYSASG